MNKHCINCKHKCNTNDCLDCDDNWSNFDVINSNGPTPEKEKESDI